MAWDDTKQNAVDPENPTANEQITATEWNNMVIDQKSRLFDIVDDTTPELGGNLDGNTFTITNISTLDTISLSIGGVAITATPVELNILDGATVTTTELNYLDGVTSPVQTQLNGKLAPTYGTAQSTFVVKGNLGATETFDFDTASNFSGILDADTTLTISNLTDGQRGQIVLLYSGAARAITWSGVDKWVGGTAPTTPAVAGEELVVTLINRTGTIIAEGGIAS